MDKGGLGVKGLEFTRSKIKKLAEKLKSQRVAKKIMDTFKLVEPSPKQKKVMTWWRENSPVKDKVGIICDGSIRSGKTLSTAFSFLVWSMTTFSDQNLILAGKTVGSFRRNVVRDLKKMAVRNGYSVKDKRSENCLVISKGDKTNYYYVFGGKDEGSADLIQGITAAGAYLDEVVLMPKSFVDQALARCSVNGSKYWFTCNPGSPYHYFKTDFIDKQDEKNLFYLHFTMEDNPTLSYEKKEEYKNLYIGTFYKRYILGLWVQAEGLIYQVSDENIIKPSEIPVCDEYYITGDYGTYNPMAWGFFGIKYNGDIKMTYLIEEYHHSGRETSPKTDEEYSVIFKKWKEKLEEKYGVVKAVVFDPSASSFHTALKKISIKTKHAYNSLMGEKDFRAGIPLVQTYISNLCFKISNVCTETIKEIYTYCWNDKKALSGEEVPVKDNDHHMDKIRYFFNTVVGYRVKKKQRFVGV